MTTANLSIQDLKAAAARLMTSEVFVEMPGFTIPSQERTRIKTAAMIAAAAHMLQTRSFSEISVDEIADVAECSVPSIYARFKNKESLLPAVHLLTIETVRKRLNEEITMDAFLGKSLEFFCEIFIDIIVDYFEINKNFVRAAILNDNKIVHRQLQDLLPLLAIRLNKIVPQLINRDPDLSEAPILFGLGLIMSLLRDAAVVCPIERSRDRRALVKLFSHVIDAGMSI